MLSSIQSKNCKKSKLMFEIEITSSRMFHGIRMNNLTDNDSLKLHYSVGPEIQEVITGSSISKKKIKRLI